VKILLSDERANVNSPDDKNRTPLSYAAESDEVENLRMFLSDDRVQIHCRDCNGRSVLSHAAGSGSSKVIKVLLSDTYSVTDDKDSEGHTPLWHCTNAFATLPLELDNYHFEHSLVKIVATLEILLYPSELPATGVALRELLVKRNIDISTLEGCSKEEQVDEWDVKLRTAKKVKPKFAWYL
jgi:hypothetical protein